MCHKSQVPVGQGLFLYLPRECLVLLDQVSQVCADRQPEGMTPTLTPKGPVTGPQARAQATLVSQLLQPPTPHDRVTRVTCHSAPPPGGQCVAPSQSPPVLAVQRAPRSPPQEGHVETRTWRLAHGELTNAGKLPRPPVTGQVTHTMLRPPHS